MSELSESGSKRELGREALAREAAEHILCARYTARELARRLGVSVPTVSRVLARLRASLAARGGELVSVRRGRAWHYEIREPQGGAWEAFARLRGFVRKPLRPIAGEIDDVVYSGR